jgi:hypothetical protein
MKKTNTYKVIVSEVLEKEIEVSATNENEAIEMAKARYKDLKIVLDLSNHSKTNFIVSGWDEINKHGCWRCKGDSILHFSKNGSEEILESETCEKCGDLR